MGMAPTERLKLRRQIAAAAGKKSATSVLVHGNVWSGSNCPLWSPSSGRKESGPGNGSANKEKRG